MPIGGAKLNSKVISCTSTATSFSSQIGAGVPVWSMTVKAMDSNTATVFIGGPSTVATQQGHELLAGETLDFGAIQPGGRDIDVDTSTVWALSSTATPNKLIVLYYTWR